MPIRLIATDLDGTLLRRDLSVSPRTRRALDGVRARGLEVVPVTARQPEGLRLIAGQAGMTGWAVCSNGALGLHLGTGEILFENLLESGTQRKLAVAITARVPGTVFVSVRDAGTVFVAQRGYSELAQYTDHKRDPGSLGGFTLEEVVARPSLKLALRHPELSPPELLAQVHSLGLSGFHATHSGAPFVEVAAQGVTKASGVARLCTHLGIAKSEVMAFGDAPNDVEMLAWAGHGVAMGNADPEARTAADEVALTNEEDGVAVVLEQLLVGG
ncbi:Cof-type HAD-IIB family hydrolase [Deinococcus sp.]|uniref:Cof-type HAD-IIB family hydrolase n=1 Tax=Deinococcus sp. TaxID=47478 RepID=UPI0025C44837|nr:HAD family hydrolase [Deinococcus sp.]